MRFESRSICTGMNSLYWLYNISVRTLTILYNECALAKNKYPKHCSNVHLIETIFTYHVLKIYPYSLIKLNWTVSYWVLSKLKSKFLFVNSTFIKILPSTNLSSCMILQVVRDAMFCITLHVSFCPNIAWIHILIMGQHGTVPGVEKHTPFPACLCMVLDILYLHLNARQLLLS